MEVAGKGVVSVVELSGQLLELPWQTVMGGVQLPFPLESLRVITTVVPTGNVTWLQVKEVPATSWKAVRTLPSLVPSWKD